MTRLARRWKARCYNTRDMEVTSANHVEEVTPGVCLFLLLYQFRPMITPFDHIILVLPPDSVLWPRCLSPTHAAEASRIAESVHHSTTLRTTHNEHKQKKEVLMDGKLPDEFRVSLARSLRNDLLYQARLLLRRFVHARPPRAEAAPRCATRDICCAGLFYPF